MLDGETLLSILIGVALAAACGFRVFVPMLVISVAAYTGNLNLASGFEWLGTLPALISFALATVLEIAGYYIPFVDHILDLLATPAAVIAGSIAMASSVVGMSPFLQWMLAIIAGGGVAGLVQGFTGLTRLASTASTGGIANPAVATVETGGALTLSVLAVLLPIAAAVLVLVVLTLSTRTLYKKLFHHH